MSLDFKKGIGDLYMRKHFIICWFFYPAPLLSSFITKMHFRCVFVFFCLILLTRQTVYLQKNGHWFLAYYIFFSCLIALGKIFRKMLSSSISAYICHFPLRILDFHYLVCCIPWCPAEDQAESLYFWYQTMKLKTLSLLLWQLLWLPNSTKGWFDTTVCQFIMLIFKISKCSSWL